MEAVDIQTALDWRGRDVLDRDGEKIGTLKEIYLDERERPAWGSVHTALFGLRHTLVPLAQAQPEGDALRVPYARDHVNDAPNLDPEVQLTPEEEERLFRHYETGSTEDAMTRSEEELHIGKRTRERGKVRLKKYVVTDYVEKKIPVRREEVRLEREPPDEPDRS
jgi:sporulation protein YlmC with PRC-barrel domain